MNKRYCDNCKVVITESDKDSGTFSITEQYRNTKHLGTITFDYCSNRCAEHIKDKILKVYQID